MKRFIFLVLITGLLACTPTGVQYKRDRESGVTRLSLRDHRLPTEARRWLADNEDEVAIAMSRLNDAQANLKTFISYEKEIKKKLEKAWSKGKASAEGDKAAELFSVYALQRVKLAKTELIFAEKAFDLAGTRLTLARAETAVRYDLAVYELEPIAREVELLKKEVANCQKEVEQQMVKVEQSADELWNKYARYVSRGGVTNVLFDTKR
jgi:hypothetical protein